MKIETKYSVGQQVYVLYKDENEHFVQVYKEVINEIAITAERILYYGNEYFDEIEEEMIVPLDKPEVVIEKINLLLEKETLKIERQSFRF